LRKAITERTRLVCCAHVSNVLGTINPVREIGRLAHQAGALFLVDGAQSAPHMPVNVKEIGPLPTSPAGGWCSGWTADKRMRGYPLIRFSSVAPVNKCAARHGGAGRK